jgi:hypothetical protein
LSLQDEAGKPFTKGKHRAGRANKVRSKLLIKRILGSDAIGQDETLRFCSCLISKLITHASYLSYTALPWFSLPQHIHLLLLFKARRVQLCCECHASSDHRDSQSDPVYEQTPRSTTSIKTTTSLEDLRTQPSTWVSTTS